MEAVQFNWVDFAIIGVVLLSTVVSLVRGFFREALSLATWIIAVYVAYRYHTVVMAYFADSISNEHVRMAIAIAILFVGILIIGAIISFIFSKLVTKTGLSGTDRSLGMLFGAGRGVVLVALMMLFAHLTPLPESTEWKKSNLVPHAQSVADWFRSLLPDKLAAQPILQPKPAKQPQNSEEA